jgi:hypothetical protein
MPLRDHFRSPANDTHSWDEVHGGWPMEIVRDLTTILPAGFRAAPKVHLGSPFEVDVSSYDLDEYEVRVYDTERGRLLVAAIEIVSPSNKDRPDTRDIFVGKVASLLQQGVCVCLADLVSVREANLYAELLKLIGRGDPALGLTPLHLYAVSLRGRKPPKRRPLLDAWFYPMTLGQPLPTLPIWLTANLRISLPLEPSYQETCRILGIA